MLVFAKTILRKMECCNIQGGVRPRLVELADSGMWNRNHHFHKYRKSAYKRNISCPCTVNARGLDHPLSDPLNYLQFCQPDIVNRRYNT